MSPVLNKFAPVLSIGAVATLINVSVHTLRFYERKGLILPHRNKSGRRRYSKHDVEHLKRIRKMITEQGLNINCVRILLSLIPCWCFKGGFCNDCVFCPAAHEASTPCWNIKNVGRKCRNQNCRECPVYRLEIDIVRLKKMLSYNYPDGVKKM